MHALITSCYRFYDIHRVVWGATCVDTVAYSHVHVNIDGVGSVARVMENQKQKSQIRQLRLALPNVIFLYCYRRNASQKSLQIALLKPPITRRLETISTKINISPATQGATLQVPRARCPRASPSTFFLNL